jgi:hypothetical protein
MNLELKIYSPFLQKALSIILAVFMGIGFSFGGALANSCQGGADCPVCVKLPHGHVPGAAAGMETPGCPSGEQNSTCGFEANQDPAEFRSIVSSVRSYRQAHAGIFASVSDEYAQTLLPKEFIPQILLSESGGAAPIYLLNQSLLC